MNRLRGVSYRAKVIDGQDRGSVALILVFVFVVLLLALLWPSVSKAQADDCLGPLCTPVAVSPDKRRLFIPYLSGEKGKDWLNLAEFYEAMPLAGYPVEEWATRTYCVPNHGVIPEPGTDVWTIPFKMCAVVTNLVITDNYEETTEVQFRWIAEGYGGVKWITVSSHTDTP